MRWGLWRVALTGNRRQTPTLLLREKHLLKDPFGDGGLGRARQKEPWPAPHHAVGVRVDAPHRRGSDEPRRQRERLQPGTPPERHACRRLLGRPPAVWLHLVRSVAGNFLDSAPGMRPSASSLMLAHTMPASADEVAPTTRKFYLSNQRMDVKTAAIAAWAGAVMDATPRPGASPRCRGSERKPDASAIGISSLTHTQEMLKILTHTHPFIGFVGYRTSS